MNAKRRSMSRIWRAIGRKKRPMTREMARPPQSDEAAQTDAQTAPRRRRAPSRSREHAIMFPANGERLPDPPQWQVQQAAEAAKKPKKRGLVSRVAKMMEEGRRQ